MPDTLTATGTDRTAVIDVGSNSVRLVIFGDNERAPLAMLNEKAFCSLGKGVSSTGKLNPDGVEHALQTLKRFEWIASVSGVRRIQAFATAAVRDAGDGADFVSRVQAECRISLKVLSGEEEARLAGMGVLFGIPDADGIVADMGGSSLELARVTDGSVPTGSTLPVGPLQFPPDLADPDVIASTVDTEIARHRWLSKERGKPLYLVGGTWRAFAKLDIGMRNYGLNIIHGYEMSLQRAHDLADLIARQSPASLVGSTGVSKRRLQVLPSASIVLDRVIAHLAPEKLVFSAHGVREGTYYDGLSTGQRSMDPLLAGVCSIAEHEARFSTLTGEEICDWIMPLFTDDEARIQRLIRAAGMLCDTGWRTHPDYRATQSFRRVLRAPLLGVDHAERMFLAVSILRRYSHKAGDDSIRDARAVLSEGDILAAERAGAAMRLALTLGGGGRGALSDVTLAKHDGNLRLSLPAALRHLVSDAVQSRLKLLATLLFVEPEISFV
ncbi:Ppx/GppA family phosphatase [Minwuia sp.]|uniref:Ppx/GppA phosphatase family protein n=1 Tax=Minwuia sp. TaxID=2493630 RepID=UPI003A8DB588